MKILYITDEIYLSGGRERALSDKANYILAKTSHKVSIITSEQKGRRPRYPLDPRVELADIYVNYERNKSYFHPSNLIKIPRHMIRLRRAIDRIKPDIIITLSGQIDYYLLPFMAAGTPLIKEFHSSIFSDGNNTGNASLVKKLLSKLDPFISQKYSRLVVLNDDEKNLMRYGKISIMPNALSHYPPGAKLENKIVISAGRIAPVKGYDLLLKAWGEASGSHSDWKLHIYGDGEIGLKSNLKKLARDMGIDGSVSFCGDRDDLMEKMSEASIYVMSSHSECFPLALLEAMSCGLPAISFDCPTGPRNIISNGEDGLLVRAGDISGLARNICKLMDDVTMRKRIGASARSSAAKYSADIVIPMWLALFEELAQLR